MDQPARGRLTKAQIEAISGSLSGILTAIATHPLELAKTRFQAPVHDSKPATLANTYNLIKGLYKSPKPYQALYRGFSPNIVGNATVWSSFFFFKFHFENGIRQFKFGPGKINEQYREIASGLWRSASRTQPRDLNTLETFAASLMAGLVSNALFNPIWIIKTAMLTTDAAAANPHKNILASARHISATQGFRGFYKGLHLTALYSAHSSLHVTAYQELVEYFAPNRHQGGWFTDAAITTGASAVSKAISTLMTYPWQVIRTRIQAPDGEVKYGKGTWEVMRRIRDENGCRGFYRGLTPALAKNIPGAIATFVGYEMSKRYLSSL